MKIRTISKLPLSIAIAAAILCSTATPARATEADDRMEKAFTDSYVSRTYLKDDSVKADADGGVITLTGTVNGEAHKTLAENTAQGLPGVTRVENKLTTEAEEDAEKSDKWIERKIKMSLLFSRNVSYSDTVINVMDGVVTLTGPATSAAQKDLTAEYAADVDGVKSVENHMTVSTEPAPPARTTGEKIDDASVTAQVRGALLSRRSTSTVKTGVVTRDGAVTVTGIAKNAAEKSLVTKLVSDVRGVSSVNNEMTVQTPPAAK